MSKPLYKDDESRLLCKCGHDKYFHTFDSSDTCGRYVYFNGLKRNDGVKRCDCRRFEIDLEELVRQEVEYDNRSSVSV